MTQTISLNKTLLEHAAAILRMKSCGLSLDWLKAYSIPQLAACCDRMEAALPGASVPDKTVQKELIQNPAFAAYYARLLPLFPEEPPVEKKPDPAYNSLSRYSYTPPAPPSPRAILMDALRGLVECCQANGRDVAAFPPKRLMAALALERLTDYARLVYLENFAPMELSGEARQTAAASLFMGHWRRNGCLLYELRTMERRTAEHPDMDWSGLIATSAGYVNQLYGSQFKNIDLSAVNDCQEDILIYAITCNKKHFIRLVDENAELFLCLPGTSALFQEALYREHFNLNELTASDLAALARMDRRQLNVKFLIPGRRYTFPELRELCGQSSRYLQLYHALQSDSQDYRLRVFRQVCKRGVLPPDMEEASIAALAASLDRKPLDAWTRTDFGHIDGLTAGDAALLLAHLDAIRHVLPSIQNRADALLVLRNLGTLGQYASVAELKDNLLRTDADWLALANRMELTPEFLEQYQESIITFLCRNGAYIAETYANGLGGKQREAFLRVVKAELMGQLADLKYYEGDLQRELDSPLTARVKFRWRENLSLLNDNLEVREHDDFFSTMLLGVQPQRTCLSYIDGQYRECLLSAFDSNKKILYATLNGRVVGRAFLRLTKGRLTGADVPDDDTGFTWTKYAVYISKSKAGTQYLDSLGGQAAVSAEGSYKANTFLVRGAA